MKGEQTESGGSPERDAIAALSSFQEAKNSIAERAPMTSTDVALLKELMGMPDTETSNRKSIHETAKVNAESLASSSMSTLSTPS